MKLSLVLAILLFYNTGKAQSVEPLIYQEVVDVDSVSQNELYNRAKTFVISFYKDARNVIQLDSKEDGKILCKGLESMQIDHLDSNISYMLSISVKDNKYKYELKDINHNATYHSTGIPYGTRDYNVGIITTSDEPSEYKKGYIKSGQRRIYKGVKAVSEKMAQTIIANLKESMLKNDTDNW